MAVWFLLSIGMFVAILACIEVGYRIGKTRSGQASSSATGENVLAGIVYGLLSLLLAFTFSLEFGRFENRRHLVVEEANAISTAYLRLDLLPKADQISLKKEFGTYIHERLAFNDALADGNDAVEISRNSDLHQRIIWDLEMESLAADPRESSRILVVPALNSMFDLAAARSEAARTRTPMLIIMLLAVVTLASACLAGRLFATHGEPGWGHRFVFAAVVSALFFVMSDMDNPRQGLLRLDGSDHIFRELQDQVDKSITTGKLS